MKTKEHPHEVSKRITISERFQKHVKSSTFFVCSPIYTFIFYILVTFILHQIRPHRTARLYAQPYLRLSPFVFSSAMVLLNPKTTEKEFFGMFGALGIPIFLPLLIIFFQLITNSHYAIKGISLDLSKVIEQIPQSWSELADICFDKKCWVAYLVWFFVLAVFDVYSPGRDVEGVELRDGTKLMYRINGRFMSSLLVVIIVARAFASENFYLPELQFLYDNQLQLTMVTIIFSFLLSFFVYFCSFIPLRRPNGVKTNERILSINGNSGNAIYDWFIGRELNPRIGSWDIKLFCELRPGMLLLFLINLSCLHQQYHTQGKVADSMWLVNAMQAFYIFEGVLNEEGCLTMMDIATDGFGFMLAFGDLAWLPWSYSLQARYLALPGNAYHLGWLKCSLILLVNVLGYYIFHSANQQKSDFKQGKLKHLKSITTPTGSKLLADGWWSTSQHINYFGDWLIGWSWCLPTGTMTLLTYFYVIYFGVLLVHRQTRDEAKCRNKYGKAWEEYEKQVPYKIVPYVY